MAINYNWVISQLECKIQEGDLQEVVYTIHYRRQATEVDGDKTYLAETYSTVAYLLQTLQILPLMRT